MLKEIERVDPFNGKVVVASLWAAADRMDVGAIAEVYRQIDIDTNEVWRDLRQIFAARSAALHEGILFELWTLIIGEEAAAKAWVPAWISHDGDAQLIKFPEQVVEWLATADSAAVANMADRWQALPYLANAAGPHAPRVGATILQSMRPMAEVAIEKHATMLAEVSGYVLP